MRAQAAESADTPTPDVVSSQSADMFHRVPRSRRAAASSVIGDGRDVNHMDELSRLIFRRKAELDLTWDDIAARGGFSSHTIVYAMAHKKERKQTPRLVTLERLAKALSVPLDVVKVAAADAAGFVFEEIPTTLESASGLRIIAASYGELEESDKEKLVGLAEAFAEQARAKRAAEGNGPQ